MKPNHITVSMGMESSVPTQSPSETFQFELLSRVITVEYNSRTTGVTTHTVVVKALIDCVTHYDGRYHVRDSSQLIVKPPHKRPALRDTARELQKFFVEFERPLKKGETTTLVMEVGWEHRKQAEHPEVTMSIVCPTEVLQILLHRPLNKNILKPQGIVRLNNASHAHIDIKDIPLIGNIYTWDIPQPKLHLFYQLTWKWPD